MKKYTKQDQKILATWAANCAKRVLPFFEKSYPNDNRPRQALKTCQTWVRTGIFNMQIIRGSSLAAHAAARKVNNNANNTNNKVNDNINNKINKNNNNAACFAARAAGQAVATAHVTQHAYGGAYYALKAIAQANPINTEAKVRKEYNWQSEHLAKHLRSEIMNRIIIEKRHNKIIIKIHKDKTF